MVDVPPPACKKRHERLEPVVTMGYDRSCSHDAALLGHGHALYYDVS